MRGRDWEGRKVHVIEAWGEYACFTSPMKVERWSYPCLTPSAARGLLDAIFVKPKSFRWDVERIEILAPVRTIALMRNEVKEKGPSEAEVRRWEAGKAAPAPLFADATEDAKGRTQRQTMALRDVRYRIHASIHRWADAQHPTPAYDEQFVRAARLGRQAHQPCFGMREFPAYWRLVESGETPAAPAAFDLDAGWMLYDVFDLSRKGRSTDGARVSLFRARIEGGVLAIPEYGSDLVRKGVSREALAATSVTGGRR